MRKSILTLMLPLLALTASCENTARGDEAASPQAASSVPNPAMSAPDQVAWEVFLSVVAPAEGGGATFETWASDAGTFTPNPQWPSDRLAVQPREVRPTQLMGKGAAHAAASGAAAQPAAAEAAPPIGPATLHNLALEEVRRNRPTFDYIVQNGLNTRSGLIKAFGKTINFPSDSVEVKTNWLTPEQVKQYYPARVTADIPANFMVVEDAQGKSWVLVAMHVISKQVPNWTWATFEHNANPGRCDIIGCYDSFGAQQAVVEPAATPEGDYGTCAQTDALRGMWGNVPAVFANYCLKGSQTDFTDPTGLVIRLGNSIIEGGFVDSSSCMTCHGTAGWDKNGLSTNDTAPIGPLPWQTFWSGTTPPLQHDPKNQQIATAADFVWSIPFCAYDDVGGTGAQCTGPR